MLYNNFYYGLSLLKILYNIDLDETEYEEIALIAWNLIGNKRVRLYRYAVNVDECNQDIELPCNLTELEAVTLGNVEEWAHSTNDTDNGDLTSLDTEMYIEGRKSFKHPLYIPGKFIKYERIGNTLHFDNIRGKVFILYKGEILDENGLPEITDKEARAIATYCAYIVKYRECISNPTTKYSMMIPNTLFDQWRTLCDQARVDRYLSQNEWDQILDIKSTHARKQYNKSLKPFQ